MRWSLFIFILSISQANAISGYAQKTKLSLEFKNASVATILSEIEDISEFYFLCNRKLVDLDRTTSIQIDNQTVEEVLSEVFKGTDIEYTITGRQIVLTPGKYLSQAKNKFQPHAISGKVADSSGSPLPGVNVFIKGTTQGTITNADGIYSLSNVPSGATLIFSFVGMKIQEIPVAGKTTIDVIMAEESIGIEEVVAVGYGTQKKINLTGSVSSVSSEELEDRPVTSVAQAMQGLVPNLQITTTDGGRPGSSLSWQIRGTGSIGDAEDSPLIVIDGVADVGGTINNLNPEDIESISVLKDAAAAAIYGSRAPYGVVLVTTKKGKSNNMKVTVNSSLSFRNPSNYLNPAGSMDFVNYYNTSAANRGVSPRYDQAFVDSLQYRIDHPELNLPDLLVRPYDSTRWYRQVAVDVNWFKEIYRDMALTHNHTISASGGTKKITYYSSLGYMDQDGLYRYGNDSYKRYSGLLNLNTEATKWLDLGFKLQLIRSVTDAPNSPMLDKCAFTSYPTDPVYDINGRYFRQSYAIHIADEGGRETTRKDAFNSTLSCVIKPFKDFRINADASLKSYDQTYTEDQKILYFYSPLGDILGTQNGADVDYILKKYSINKYYAGNIYADYTKQLGNHHLYFLAGAQLEYNQFSQLYGYREERLNDNLLSLTAAVGETMTLTDNETEWANKGYFARFNYNYKEKYLIEFNGRYDGSSRFPSDYRWGFFPSVSVGYNIAKELWFAPIAQVFNTMKLRASYGTLGNSNVDLYYQATMSKLTSDYIGSDGTFLEYVSAPGLGNYHLTWEKPRTLNLALDLALFDNCLQTSFDWYRRKTIDMIGPSEPVAAVLGVTVPNTNNTEMKGTGWEWTLSYKGAVRDFRYQATLNVSRHREVVTKYYNEEGLFTTYYNGKEIGEIWGFETVGIIQDEATLNSIADHSEISSNTWALGDIQYKDQLTVDTNNDGIPDAGDGKISRGSKTLDDPGDLVRIGNTTPDYAYNITLDCSYKGFDLRMFFRGLGHTDWWPSSGQGTYSSYTNYVFFGGSNYYNNAVLEEHLDYWTEENTGAYYARALASNSTSISLKNYQAQTRYLQNRAYLRLKNVQLGYTLPYKWFSKYQIQNARFYVSGENLLTFTKLKIFDPETPGNIYPLQKVYSVGIKVTF